MFSPLVCQTILIGDSDYFALTFKMVVEHIQDVALTHGRGYQHFAEALNILLTLAKYAHLPFVDAAWVGELLDRAVKGHMDDEQFALLLGLGMEIVEEDGTVDTVLGDFVLVQGFGTDPQSFTQTMISEAFTPDGALFSKIMESMQTCLNRDHNWAARGVYGGLIAMRHIRQLGPSPFDEGALQMLHDAMNCNNRFDIRRAAYDVMLVTRDLWLKSENLRQRLEDLDFFRQLRRVAVETGRSDYQRSFLMMIEILSEDAYWHSHLKEAMDMWLPLRHDGPGHALRILANVSELSLPMWGDQSLDEYLQKLVVDEWAAVPGRHVCDLTADRLKPLAEATERFKELLFDDSAQREVLAKVEQVIPGLEKRRDDDYEGPGEDVCGIVNDLLEKLQLPPIGRSTDD